MSVLNEILAETRSQVDAHIKRCPESELWKQIADLPPTRDFLGALLRAEPPALIAEIKKASPSRGVLREDFDPVEIARIYEENGAHCISVLTDKPHFQGRMQYLREVRKVTTLPLLRKDFIIHRWQVLESRAAGADAILLIVAALREGEVRELVEVAHEVGLACLIEVHTAAELEEALRSSAKIIGINNRDLHVFRTHLRVTLELAPKVPSDRVIVSESGISTHADLEKLRAVGVRAVLIGEAFMRAQDIGAKVREILGKA
jgi:indole-3-glycerol phosphate synthase